MAAQPDYAAALLHCSQAVCITDVHGGVLWFNPAFAGLFGTTLARLEGRGLAALFAAVSSQLSRCLAERLLLAESGSTRFILDRYPSSCYQLSWHTSDLDQRIYLISDVTAEFEIDVPGVGVDLRQARANRFALGLDACGLTQVFSRLGLLEQLGIVMAEKADHQVALVLFELDGFDAIRACYGVSVADQALVVVAERLKAVLRAGCLIGRVGTHQFAIVLTGLLQRDSVLTEAERLRKAIADAYAITTGAANIFLRLAVSVGVAVAPHQPISASLLMRQADLAMLDSKARGADSISIFSPSLDSISRSHQHLQRLFDGLVHADDLDLNITPVLSAASGSVVAYRLSLSVPSLAGGDRDPNELIETAASLGYAAALDRLLIQVALADPILASQCATGIDLCLTLNAESLRQPAFAEGLFAAIQAADRPAHACAIAVHLDDYHGRPEDILQSLHYCHAAGVQIWLDNFGSHAASLQWLSALPLSAVVLHQHFLDAWLCRDDAAVALTCFQALLRGLGLNAVVSYRVDAMQRHLLVECGFDLHDDLARTRADALNASPTTSR